MIDLATAALPQLSPGARAAVLFVGVVAWSAAGAWLAAKVSDLLGRMG